MMHWILKWQSQNNLPILWLYSQLNTMTAHIDKMSKIPLHLLINQAHLTNHKLDSEVPIGPPGDTRLTSTNWWDHGHTARILPTFRSNKWSYSSVGSGENLQRRVNCLADKGGAAVLLGETAVKSRGFTTEQSYAGTRSCNKSRPNLEHALVFGEDLDCELDKSRRAS